MMWALVVIWAIAAWRAVQPAQGEKEPDLHPDDLVDFLWELAGERKGVHLSKSAAQLSKETRCRSAGQPGYSYSYSYSYSYTPLPPRAGEGLSALFTPDPQQPNRTHVEITKETP
ncbi:hypothetical protein ACIP3U_32235 [[Kitasatospora] papulosa]|uniref:hypothetical protein n=1 Tax=[Kitasatospora] papulosa TaxID=1464011 RepID=UPI0038259B87